MPPPSTDCGNSITYSAKVAEEASSTNRWTISVRTGKSFFPSSFSFSFLKGWRCVAAASSSSSSAVLTSCTATSPSPRSPCSSDEDGEADLPPEVEAAETTLSNSRKTRMTSSGPWARRSGWHSFTSSHSNARRKASSMAARSTKPFFFSARLRGNALKYRFHIVRSACRRHITSGFDTPLALALALASTPSASAFPFATPAGVYEQHAFLPELKGESSLPELSPMPELRLNARGLDDDESLLLDAFMPHKLSHHRGRLPARALCCCCCCTCKSLARVEASLVSRLPVLLASSSPALVLLLFKLLLFAWASTSMEVVRLLGSVDDDTTRRSRSLWKVSHLSRCRTDTLCITSVVNALKVFFFRGCFSPRTSAPSPTGTPDLLLLKLPPAVREAMATSRAFPAVLYPLRTQGQPNNEATQHGSHRAR
mmetsp:Transcript_2241/g.5207  ORF Transcript_2241/g.5207 Transcript_2241/m.5207 type:complete len:426 (+) Transcript_2241:850-2127(+)